MTHECVFRWLMFVTQGRAVHSTVPGCVGHSCVVPGDKLIAVNGESVVHLKKLEVAALLESVHVKLMAGEPQQLELRSVTPSAAAHRIFLKFHAAKLGLGFSSVVKVWSVCLRWYPGESPIVPACHML